MDKYNQRKIESLKQDIENLKYNLRDELDTYPQDIHEIKNIRYNIQVIKKELIIWKK